MSMADSKEDFYSRVARVHAVQNQRDVAAARAKHGGGGLSLGFLLSLVATVGLAALAILAGRAAQFHLARFYDFGDNLLPAVMFEWTVILCVILLSREIFRLKTRSHLTAVTLGMMVGVTALHNAVWAVPALFETMFSKAWVAQVITTTDARSLIFGPITYVF